MSRSDLVATAKLRWLECDGIPMIGDDGESIVPRIHVLEQWWAPDVPSYLQNDRDGEWRRIPAEPDRSRTA